MVYCGNPAAAHAHEAFVPKKSRGSFVGSAVGTDRTAAVLTGGEVAGGGSHGSSAFLPGCIQKHGAHQRPSACQRGWEKEKSPLPSLGAQCCVWNNGSKSKRS